MHRTSRILLAVLLSVTAAAKILTGHASHFVLGPELYWLSAVFEAASAFFLFRNRYTMLIAWSVLAFAATGVVWSMSTSAPCGCLGRVASLSPKQHVLLTCLVGILASVTAMREDPEPGTPGWTTPAV